MQKPVRRKDREIDRDGGHPPVERVRAWHSRHRCRRWHQPYAVPLSYVFHDQCIYFHCATEGHKLDNIRANPAVSFCVVGQDPDATRRVRHRVRKRSRLRHSERDRGRRETRGAAQAAGKVLAELYRFGAKVHHRKARPDARNPDRRRAHQREGETMRHRSPGRIKWTSPGMPCQKVHEMVLSGRTDPSRSYSLACRPALPGVQDGMTRP